MITLLESPAGTRTGLKVGNLGALSFTSNSRIDMATGDVVAPPVFFAIALRESNYAARLAKPKGYESDTGGN